MNFQGQNSTDAFHGKSQSKAMQSLYKDSVPLFAQIIRNNLKPSKYTLVDFGGHKGELVSELLSALPEYEFDSTIIDKGEGMEAGVNAKKIVGDIINNSLPDKSADLVLLRYVLPWDAYENQKLILNEVKRVCKTIAIIQHQGAPSDNPKPLQEASLRLWSGLVPTLKRDHGYFTEATKIEKWMQELGMNFEKVEEKYVETLSEMFTEKFHLNAQEAAATKDILKGCDGISITTWIIHA